MHGKLSSGNLNCKLKKHTRCDFNNSDIDNEADCLLSLVRHKLHLQKKAEWEGQLFGIGRASPCGLSLRG